MTLDALAQLPILLLSGLASYFVGRPLAAQRRIGYALGLLGQPFWFYVTLAHHQWGMLLLSFWYTWAWYNGLRNHWNMT